MKIRLGVGGNISVEIWIKERTREGEGEGGEAPGGTVGQPPLVLSPCPLAQPVGQDSSP